MKRGSVGSRSEPVVAADMNLLPHPLFATRKAASCPSATLATVRSCCQRLSGSRRAVPARGSCGGGRRVRRLHSGAQSRGPSPNSLRALRALRSDRRRQVSLQSALRARAASLPLLVAPEIAPAGYRPPRAEPVVMFSGRERLARWSLFWLFRQGASTVPQRRGRAGGSAPSEAPSSAGLSARARSALRELTCRRMSERSARRARSEFGDGPEVRAAQGSRHGPRRGPFVALRRPPRPSAVACPAAPLHARPSPTRTLGCSRIQLHVVEVLT